jgi:hypothetical protein
MQSENGSGEEMYEYTEAPLPIPTRSELLEAGINILVGIPMERYLTDWSFIHFWQIAKRGWPLIDHVYGRTDSNRNRMAKFLLEHPEFTHICMLDLDHIHAPNIVERLASWVLEDPSRLVVGGLHFRRAAPFDPCAFVYGPDGQLHAPLEWEQGLFEVHVIGHGSVLFAREVFERLPEPWWAYTYDRCEENIYPSEDMWFSHLCVRNGVKLWCDTTITSPHLILNTVDEDTFNRYIADHPEIRITAEEMLARHANGQVKPEEAAYAGA